MMMMVVGGGEESSPWANAVRPFAFSCFLLLHTQARRLFCLWGLEIDRMSEGSTVELSPIDWLLGRSNPEASSSDGNGSN